MHAFAERITSQMLEVTSFDAPRDKSGLFEFVEPEGSRFFRGRLLRIGGDYFQVGRWAKRDQGVPGSAPRVLASGDRAHA
jgi:hypothetical protein